MRMGGGEEHDGDDLGTAVNDTARLMVIGHGEQVLCSQATASLVTVDVVLVDVGQHGLRDLSAAERGSR